LFLTGQNLRYAPELTTSDVANLLGVTPATVRMWVRRGHITPIGKYRNSNVFGTRDVLDADDAIRSRTKSVASSRRVGSDRFRWERPAVNIPAKFHDGIVDVRQAAALAKVRPATIRTWIHRGHLQPLPSSQPREVHLRVGDVFKAARRDRRPTRPRRARLS
jgi:predicted site-specific integrase-resolvase